MAEKCSDHAKYTDDCCRLGVINNQQVWKIQEVWKSTLTCV